MDEAQRRSDFLVTSLDDFSDDFFLGVLGVLGLGLGVLSDEVRHVRHLCDDVDEAPRVLA
eukprot:CAMPEP_0197608946 /NCGR_PEP_ID=MMETSP1326-20131121/50158_1 /TAXON_ID=1155430 /ORGANISM="Genus nov. species nov., Strain RCC2288" /LENGTH=59 /DNA_ID=CAMNT_0043177237 /DNA_START=82 /DNA_END=257 /DNA_ORIENTATION=-